MAPTATAPSTAEVPAKKAQLHPLDELTLDEHNETVKAVKEKWPQCWFKYVQRKEPSKDVLTPFLDGKTDVAPPRVAEVCFIQPQAVEIHMIEYDFASRSLQNHQQAETGAKAPLDTAMLEKYEHRILASPEVAKAIEELGLPKDTKVCADPWIYGADTEDDTPAYMQFLMYMRPPSAGDDLDAFHYAYPLPFVPVVDIHLDQIVRLDWVFTGNDVDGMKKTWQDKFNVSHYKANEYMPHLHEGYNARNDLKPLIVEQPEGASFNVKGREIAWQKWTMRISWNWREGLVLHDVRYDGRSTFYRLSVSEMTVPYGDPRPPLHRKQAFDLGDAGAGVTANSLDLGCDCLGHIHYFDGDVALADGKLLRQKNVVCLHEQDMGIGMKHTNYRTNKPFVTRNRQLVLQTIITVANYEYIFMWYFDQAGAIHFETRATGVLSVSAIDEGKISRYGNVVAPGVLGTNHQHIFCLRIHPRVDGDGNTVTYEESRAMPWKTAEDKAVNPFGTGYTVEKTKITHESFADLDATKNRTFKIVNPKIQNGVSQRDVGFKLHLPATQLLLAHPESVAAKRAAFAQHHVWVTKHREGDYWAGGKWTNQSNGKAGGVGDMIKQGASVDNEDIVVWAVFGLTHNPRVEDFPIMPVENTMVSLKPADFFERNPAMDVPVSMQAINKSVLHSETPSSSCCR